MKKYLLICFSIIILSLLNSQNVFASSCTKGLGSTVYCDDGSSYTQVGNKIYTSDGTTYTSGLGSTIYGSDGSSYTTVGNKMYGSDGTTYTGGLGNTIYGSDGSSYTTVGNKIYIDDEVDNNTTYTQYNGNITNTESFPHKITPTCPLNSYYDGISSCKCDYGYIIGSYGQCESTITVCSETMGFMSQYNTLSNTCECMHGYKFSGGRCVNNNTLCYDQTGYNSSYDSSSDQCKCNSGYIIGTSGQCVSAISYCSTQLGVMSRYNSISKKCECMIGYEFNGSGCVYKTINYPTQTYKKNINQNNAKNIDTFNPNDWVEVPTPTQKDSPDILSFNYGQSDTATSTSTTTAINKSSFWGKMSHYLNPFSWFKK